MKKCKNLKAILLYQIFLTASCLLSIQDFEKNDVLFKSHQIKIIGFGVDDFDEDFEIETV